jgi:alpha-L-fucosidase
MYMEQITELLTNYGPIHEVWFDGANGEGPNGKRQVYDWPRTFGLVKRLQPDSVIFSDAGPDIRWIGNEIGSAGSTNWSTMNPAAVPYPGASGPGIIEALQQGDPAGTVWRPGETDVSIRPGWFYHPAEDSKVRPVENLVQLYFTSVGRNSKLLLNVPPTREGLLHDTDVARLRDMRVSLDTLFATDVARGRRLRAAGSGAGVTLLEVDLGRSAPVSIVSLQEDITRGQAVARYDVTGSDGVRELSLGGPWKSLSRGTTIGYRKLDRFQPVPVRHVRVIVQEALRPPRNLTLELF